MGKGKKKGGTAAAAAADDDDALLAAAIAENLLISKEAAEATGAPAEAQSGAPAGAALSRQEIVVKLNAIPTFCLLNAEKGIVGMQNDGGGETCCWFTDAHMARACLKEAQANNLDVPNLHLGVTPLGLAFSFAAGWQRSNFIGQMLIQGHQDVVNDMAPALRAQLEAQGIEPGHWQLPVFVCDELQSPTVMPVFMSRSDLVQAWVASGRERESVPDNLGVMDLRVLVAQMQTDVFAWKTVAFVGSPSAVELVREAKALSNKVVADKLMDEPPPLEASADRDLLPTLKNIEPSQAPPPTHDDDDLQEAD